MNLPKTVTMQVDTREQYPLLFPATVRIPHPERLGVMCVVAVKVQKIKLDCGDYRLAEYPKCCVIERKASQLELFKNLEDSLDSIRQAKAFRRLREVEFPYLLIEATPQEVFEKTKMVQDPDKLVARLCVVLAKYGFGVLWWPWGRRTPENRRKIGGVLVHLMLACALKNKIDILPEVV